MLESLEIRYQSKMDIFHPTREYEDKLRYSPATDFLVYNGSFWEESQPNAQGIA